MRLASLFSGIGGFEIAAENVGWEVMFQCEIDPFCNKILNYYWPETQKYYDIKKSDFTIWRGRVDVLCGGFPCQPYSHAGKRLGKDDEPPTPEYFEQLFRISKNQIIWGGNYFHLPPTRCIICWDKMQPWDNFSQWEMAWTSFDKPAKMYRISNTGGRNDETRIHPTQKPVKLYARLYTDFAKFGMKVFDSHLGSGSNRIAAANFGMDFTGCEKNRNHYEDQEIRWREYQKNHKIIFPTIE